jgi:hypothetical protein
VKWCGRIPTFRRVFIHKVLLTSPHYHTASRLGLTMVTAQWQCGLHNRILWDVCKFPYSSFIGRFELCHDYKSHVYRHQDYRSHVYRHQRPVISLYSRNVPVLK